MQRKKPVTGAEPYNVFTGQASHPAPTVSSLQSAFGDELQRLADKLSELYECNNRLEEVIGKLGGPRPQAAGAGISSPPGPSSRLGELEQLITRIGLQISDIQGEIEVLESLI